jgi:hypothetical protein
MKSRVIQDGPRERPQHHPASPAAGRPRTPASVVREFVRDHRRGLRDIGARLIRWRVGWIWYVVAVAVPLGVHAVAIGVNVAGGAEIDTGQFSPFYGVARAIGMNVVNPTGGPFSEQPSFRGYALPILQGRHSPLVATSILAVAVRSTQLHG